VEGQLLVVARAEGSRLEIEEKTETARQRSLKRELEWVRMAPRARQAKSKRACRRYEQLVSESGIEARGETNEIYIPPGPRLGDVVVRAEGVKKSFGDKLLFEDLRLRPAAGGIVGVIGPNGAGKTTLFKMIMGLEKPDGGKAPGRRDGRPELRGPEPREARREEDRPRRALAAAGPRPPRQARDPVARVLRDVQLQGRRPAEARREPVGRRDEPPPPRPDAPKGGNLLLLDEPTNDLDVDTLRALEEALLSFGGCAVVISHDRWFLDRVATHMLAFESDSKTVWYEGNYQDYEADRHKRLGAEADRPHRIKYRKIDERRPVRRSRRACSAWKKPRTSAEATCAR
jgi:sulfate-transporting ATPase